MIAGRAVASAPYPVLDELRGLGLRVLPIDDPTAVASFVQAPDTTVLRDNRAVITRELNLADLPEKLSEAFRRVGWTDW